MRDEFARMTTGFRAQLALGHHAWLAPDLLWRDFIAPPMAQLRSASQPSLQLGLHIPG